MEYQTYLTNVKDRYQKDVFLEVLDATMFYEAQFELKWLATKLKQYSFVSFSDTISLEDITEFSRRSLKYALKNYKGLPRGLQNGVACFNVLAGNKIDQQAIDFALSRPKKHFSAFEMPIIVDLQKEKLYYYSDTPIWGALYYGHFREYISNHLNIDR